MSNQSLMYLFYSKFLAGILKERLTSEDKETSISFTKVKMPKRSLKFLFTIHNDDKRGFDVGIYLTVMKTNIYFLVF